MALSQAQIKGRIKNIAKTNKSDARILMRIYMMERFLERMAKSKYSENFIIKGGILITSLVGVSLRSTMDIDTSIRGFTLSQEEAMRIVKEISEINLEDDVTFRVKSVSGIMDEMATETVSKSLMFRPASYYILETKRRVYKCPVCQKNNDRFIRKQESPAVLLPHSVVSPSLLAHVITQKFVYSMPLYRQEQQMIDAGIPIVRKVLSDWCQKVFSNQLENFCELLRQELFKYGHIHADETPVEVIKTHEGRKPKQQYMWVYSTTKWAPHQIRYFKHECGRSSDYPLKFLKGFEGYLHTDGYIGYDKTVRESRGKIIRCECLVHARRHFADILKLAKDKQNSETMLAAKAVTLLDRVFVVEKEANLSCVDGSGVRDKGCPVLSSEEPPESGGTVRIGQKSGTDELPQ